MLVLVLATMAATVAEDVPEAVAPAAGTEDVRVQVGAAPPGGAALPFSYTRYYPEHLTVHRGQTVVFETAEQVDLHTVSFSPGGDAAPPPIFRHNEEPEPIAINEVAWQRSACGDEGQAACRLDGSEQALSSGLSEPALAEPAWRVTVDLPVGSTAAYFCMVHPGMEGSIEVVDDDVAVPTQAQIDAETRAQVRKDTKEAIKHRAERDGEMVQRREGDRTVWRVLVGDSSPSGHVSIRTYMPGRLDGIRPRDAVEFVSAGTGHHSVTFPTELVGHKGAGPDARLAFGVIHPTCDFDELNGGAPGVPGPWAPISDLVCPATFELVLAPWLDSPHRAPGDAVATATSYHDSGLMWSDQVPEAARGRPAGSGEYFLHRFVAEFPVAGTFRYACTIHGAENMAGTIHVEP